MMEAVGMTGGQLKKMLVSEGSFYAFFTIIVSIVTGLVIQETIVKHMMAATWFFEFHFTIMPITIEFLLKKILNTLGREFFAAAQNQHLYKNDSLPQKHNLALKQNPLTWFSWLFQEMKLKGKEQILEIGCGDGSLWKGQEIPKGCQITLWL